MDIEDYNTISNYNRDYDNYILPNKKSRDAVDAHIDIQAVTWAIISMVIDMLGDQANKWKYRIEGENNHVSVWPTEAGINRDTISDLEDSAKHNLRIRGFPILEPKDIENRSDEEPSQSEGPLTAISDAVCLICDCWLAYTTKLGLIRSGNFIKNKECKDSARDLELWRFRNDHNKTGMEDGEMFTNILKE
ncbi:hypothetical protein SOMG_04074 [Schizosaccharomyces osmophilus]|uniref:Uncharacterized protein n=1 Tax=Schizosaccharomyces osmophilus TaxID=2545709 RepID=A0AAE9W6J0_9SCHI|nr:uncharacterized protein SOMG_02508 [Schizosaccharomyces osmophilus]XP_056037447.1 uncharacterized protein SOMG_04074 [Schizosaccharomyces osmophilus]WBW70829.1 hypothetical protein SOMG_02508 [Schizosaccharomyces osmophilus]WBW73204.1 hypothetical protein SOMG_04074 [Schizosaccharomyces osmophilus]